MERLDAAEKLLYENKIPFTSRAESFTDNEADLTGETIKKPQMETALSVGSIAAEALPSKPLNDMIKQTGSMDNFINAQKKTTSPSGSSVDLSSPLKRSKRRPSAQSIKASDVQLSSQSNSKKNSINEVARDKAVESIPDLEVSTSTSQILLQSSETGLNTIERSHLEKGSTNSGNALQLIERLVDPNVYDNQFLQTFLMNYPLFVKAETVMTEIKRLCQCNEAVGSADELAKKRSIRSVNFMKLWIEQYWQDFTDNSYLFKLLNEFIDSLENKNLSLLLRKTVSKKLKPADQIVIFDHNYPKPILPKGKNEDKEANKRQSFMMMAFTKSTSSLLSADCKLVDCDPLEIARQLTLIEFEIFTSIKPRELLDCSWMKEARETLAPNVLRMMRWSNHVIHWLTNEIVSLNNLKHRVAMFERVIAVAHNLEKLNNFNGVKEIMGALNSSPVHRLKKTKEAIGHKYMKMFDALKKLTSHEFNCKELRNRVHS
jgi:hypothetical protein